MLTTKYAFVDLEVFKPSKEIKEISIKPMIDGKLMSGINLKVKIMGSKSKATKDHNNNALTVKAAFKKVIDYLNKYINVSDPNDKFVFVAHYAAFDVEHLMEFFNLNGNKYFHSYFYHHKIDTIQLALVVLSLTNSVNQVNSFSLDDLCSYYDIKIDKELRHTSKYDTCLLVKLFKKLQDEMYRMRGDSIPRDGC